MKVEDVSDTKLNESETIERHNRVLSTISHDLKSPMVAILGFSNFLMKDMATQPHDPRWMEMLKRVVSAGQGMQELIDDILSMVKMEAGSEQVQPEWVADLGHELGDTVKTFEYEAKAKGIGLSIAIVSALPPVRWDIRRIRYHVLNNIISNALKFTPSGGSVELSAETAANAVRIRISDTGPGIPLNEQQRIFCRFEQGDMKSERVFKGAGLGLYNANLFVTQHGGGISVESSTGEGTTFLIELPLDAAL